MGPGEWIALASLVLVLIAQFVGLVWFVARLVASRDAKLAEAMAAMRKDWQGELAEADRKHAASIHAHGAEVRAVAQDVAALRLENERRFGMVPAQLAELLRPISDLLGEMRDALVANGLMGPRPARRHAHEDNGA